MEPENQPLEKEIPIENYNFQVPCSTLVGYTWISLDILYLYRFSQANEPTMSFLCPVDRLTIHPGELVLLAATSRQQNYVEDSDITQEIKGK